MRVLRLVLVAQCLHCAAQRICHAVMIARLPGAAEMEAEDDAVSGALSREKLSLGTGGAAQHT